MIFLLFAGAFITSAQSWRFIADCGKLNDCTIWLSSEDDKWLKFDNNQKRVPFIADLKCILRKAESDKEDTSYAYQQHEVFTEYWRVIIVSVSSQ